jgi:TrmH family RNA methyltransferase
LWLHLKWEAVVPEKALRITSLQNDQVKALVRLRNRRERDQRQVTVIEEPLVIARALDEKYPLDTIYWCPEMLQEATQGLLEDLMRTGATVVELSPPVMTKVAYRDQSAGLLVVAPQRRQQLADLVVERPAPPLLVVLEGVEKPGNLGAVLRVADGAGADGVIVCGKGTDLFNPNVLRASRGAFFSVPTVECTGAELVAFLAREQIRAVATSPVADTSWDCFDFTGPVAIMLGTEHDGLSTDLLSNADATVGIPMLGRVDSLNVSTSTGILLYEAVRQRQTSA